MVLGVRSFFFFLLMLFYFVAMCKPWTAGLDFLISKTARQANTMLFLQCSNKNHLQSFNKINTKKPKQQQQQQKNQLGHAQVLPQTVKLKSLREGSR